ncbi:MAG: hypothetical protein WCD79_00410 [Chthoniobacteraceae bacterium]
MMPSGETPTEQLRRELWEASQSTLFRTGKTTSVLEKIAHHKHAGLIKDIIPFLWAKEGSVVSKTATVLSELLQRVTVEHLSDFDSEIRSGWSCWQGTNSLDATQIERLKSCPSWWWAFAILASHPNGFVRQAALKELANEETGESLPFILLRTTDWVEPVRVAARKIVNHKLGTVGGDQFGRCLPLVFRMRNALRHQPVGLFDEVEKLAAAGGNDIFLSAGPYDSGAFLCYLIQLSKRYGNFPLDQLICKASMHSNVGLRLLACDWLAEDAVTQETRDKYDGILLEDKSPLVRVRAFWRIANADPEKYLLQIERALMDTSAAVQDTARGAWRMLLHKDALSFYRKQIAEAKRSSAIIAAIRGLRAESNIQDDILARPFLDHNSARVRAEALRTLAGWDANDLPHLLHEALRSSSPSYSKAAGALLITRQKLLSASIVKELLINPRHSSSQKIALWLFGRMPKWSSLPLILLAYSISDCHDQALVVFKNWNRDYNRTQSSPSKSEAMEAVDAFQKISGSPLSQNRDLLAIISYLKSLK